jgi:hypothetical protein
MSVLWDEVAAGKVGTNVSNIGQEVEHLVAMVTRLVEEYQAGNRTVNELLDWGSFSNIFTNFQQWCINNIQNITAHW